MKKIIIPSFVVLILSNIFSYRIGYCNASDRYIDAKACKPMRKIGLFKI